MTGQLFIAQGDITRLCADAIAVTSGQAFRKESTNFDFLVGNSDQAEFRTRWNQAQDTTLGPTWMTLSPHKDPHPAGIAFVRPEFQRDSGVGAALMVLNAVETAIENLRAMKSAQSYETGASSEPRSRYLIALIAFLMGKGGDANDKFLSAEQQVRAAYEAVDRHPDIDIVFVLDNRAKYEIFLEARRRYHEETQRERPTFPSGAPADLVRALKHGECVAFIGAGMSKNSGLSGYRELIQHMAKEVGMPDDVGADQDAYLDIAQIYRDKSQGSPIPSGVMPMDGLIKSRFGDASLARPSLAHYLLLALPLRFVVTTNYDALLEDCLEALHCYPTVVHDKEDVAKTGYRDGTFVVKLHGDAKRGRAIVSRNDYDGFFHERPEMAAVLESLLLNQTFFFIGYSLRDPDFRQIYGKIGLMLRNARRPAYAVSLDRTPLILREYFASRQLNLIELPSDTHSEPPSPQISDREKQRHIIAFLDGLCEEVSEGTRLFLAPDNRWPAQESSDGIEQTDSLQAVRASLETVGMELSTAITEGSITPDQVQTAARILSLIADMGWRPIPVRSADFATLEALWERLADVLPGEGAEHERRQLLLTALRHANGITVARRLQKQLGDLDNTRSKHEKANIGLKESGAESTVTAWQ